MTHELHTVDPDRRVEPIEVLPEGRRAVVVGGGSRAIGPVGHLLRGRARVTVIAAALETAVEDLVGRGLVEWIPRDLAPGDLDGAEFVAAATGSPRQDEEIRAEARRTGALVMAPVREEHARPAREGGSVVLVGGGPGAPGLITVAGREAVLTADVVVVDRLAPLALLDELGPEVEVVDVSKIPRGRFTPQEEINAVLVDRALAGRRVARLKGGDPFVFGRGMEEVIACEQAGVPVEVIPGVTSSVAGPALAGVPVTHRGMVQGFAVVSGHAAPDDPRSTVDWVSLGRSGVTLVVLMGVETLPRIARALVDAGRPTDTPVASVMDAALPSQRVHTTTLGALLEGAPPGVTAPAVTIVGDVAAFAGTDLAASLRSSS